MVNCRDCRYFKYWPATYWEPSDADCEMLDSGRISEDVIDHVFCDGDDFDPFDEEHGCPCYEPAPAEDDYWDRYAWEENHYDKDEID